MLPLPEKHDGAGAAIGHRHHYTVGLGTIDHGNQNAAMPTTPAQDLPAPNVPSEHNLTAPGYGSELFPDFHHPDPFDLPIHQEFRRQPYHCRRMRGRVDVERLLRDHGQSLLRSDMGLLPDGRREAYRVLLNPVDKLFVHLDESELTVYSASAPAADQWCEQLRSYVSTRFQTRPCFLVINVRPEGPVVECVEVSQRAPLDSADLALHYGSDFLEWESEWLARLHAPAKRLEHLQRPARNGQDHVPPVHRVALHVLKTVTSSISYRPPPRWC